jgi:hypothetical protein
LAAQLAQRSHRAADASIALRLSSTCDHPADASGPRSINCYQITEHSADAAAFQLDPSRVVYSLRWKHNATPPDFELVLLQDDPELWQRWVNAASLTLLAELRRRAPEAIDWERLAEAGIVDMLDAFEAARDSRAAHQH